MIVWMLASCTESRLDTGFWTLEYPGPQIEVFEVECENEQWNVDVWTTHWAGNGLLWIADNNRYERHSLYSISADPTGSNDQLRVQLPIVSDWRDAQSGRSSGFGCTEQDRLGFFAGVRHPQTLEITDCAEYIDAENFTNEPTLTLWERVPLPDCPVNVETPTE